MDFFLRATGSRKDVVLCSIGKPWLQMQIQKTLGPKT